MYRWTVLFHGARQQLWTSHSLFMVSLVSLSLLMKHLHSSRWAEQVFCRLVFKLNKDKYMSFSLMYMFVSTAVFCSLVTDFLLTPVHFSLFSHYLKMKDSFIVCSLTCTDFSSLQVCVGKMKNVLQRMGEQKKKIS